MPPMTRIPAVQTSTTKWRGSRQYHSIHPTPSRNGTAAKVSKVADRGDGVLRNGYRHPITWLLRKWRPPGVAPRREGSVKPGWTVRFEGPAKNGPHLW